MKKLIALLLVAVMCCSLVACGGGEEPLKSTTDLSDLLGGGSKTTAETTTATTESLTNDTSVTTTLDTTTAETPVVPDYSDHSANSKDNAAENNEEAPVVQENSEQQTSENKTPNIVEIELTVENFDTYFELVEVPIFYENEFGETDEMDLYQYYLVREEYNVSDMTDFAIEYSCVWGRKDCEVDFTNLTYTLSDFKDTTPPANVMTDRFYDIEVNGQERFGFSIDGSGKSVKKSYGSIGEVGYSVDFEILRVKGTLFLMEE